MRPQLPVVGLVFLLLASTGCAGGSGHGPVVPATRHTASPLAKPDDNAVVQSDPCSWLSADVAAQIVGTSHCTLATTGDPRGEYQLLDQNAPAGVDGQPVLQSLEVTIVRNGGQFNKDTIRDNAAALLRKTRAEESSTERVVADLPELGPDAWSETSKDASGGDGSHAVSVFALGAGGGILIVDAYSATKSDAALLANCIRVGRILAKIRT